MRGNLINKDTYGVEETDKFYIIDSYLLCERGDLKIELDKPLVVKGSIRVLHGSMVSNNSVMAKSCIVSAENISVEGDLNSEYFIVSTGRIEAKNINAGCYLLSNKTDFKKGSIKAETVRCPVIASEVLDAEIVVSDLFSKSSLASKDTIIESFGSEKNERNKRF